MATPVNPKLEILAFAVSDIPAVAAAIAQKAENSSSTKSTCWMCEDKTQLLLNEALNTEPDGRQATEDRIINKASELFYTEVEELLAITTLDNGELVEKDLVLNFYSSPFKKNWRLPGFIAAVNECLRAGPYGRMIRSIVWQGVYSASSASQFVSLRVFPGSSNV